MKKVSMYTLSICPWCRKTKQFFNQHHIPFEFVDYDLADGTTQDKIRRDRARDMQIVCPCIPFHREHFDAMKRCWCGLFVHRDVTDPDSLPQMSAKEMGIE